MIDGAERPVLTVGQFMSGIAAWFANHRQLQGMNISGEVSDLREGSGGQLTFVLKEGSAVLNCVAWSDKRRGLPDFANGNEVVATGNLRVWRERSSYALHVEAVKPTGVGALYLQYERLKEQFRREGLFLADRKRQLPKLPWRIALISARGKGAEDFERTIRQNVPFVDVTFVESRVQGIGAEIEIAEKLDVASRLSVDVIVLGRGGGTYEDLFTFNLEPVVRAILRAKAPVVTAIGHTGDHHLADDVADASFGTPSLAAEFFAKNWERARRDLWEWQRRLRGGLDDALRRSFQTFDRAGEALRGGLIASLSFKRASLSVAAGRLERQSPQRTIGDARTRLANAAARVAGSADRLTARKNADYSGALHRFARGGDRWQNRLAHQLHSAQQALDRCDPTAPLHRGYAIVTKDGRAVLDAATVRPGDRVTALLERGMLHALVESAEQDNDRG